ncbi:YIEGIA domain-containing protein [Romboutsia sp. 13368]|uniref:YIEGIA domain-containing protein n=1 Tax=Romboutsia sp. 13368 TaxID=2708053 RepID=UPI0025F85A1C|nr:YIEGIA domain-containing protein [Romboutsia sp. 13368]
MKESLIADELFRRAFIVALLIGIFTRGLVLRITDKQYPSRPQDYLEQIIISGLAAALGAIAFPALIDKEFSALTFFAVAIQQFQGLSQEEQISIENIDEGEVVPKGAGYIEEISSTYESRSYISLFSSLVASVLYIYPARAYKLGFLPCTILAIIGGAIVGFIFKWYLKRRSIGDIADVVEAKINFDGPILKVNDVYINNIGLEDSRDRYLNQGIAIEVVPKDMKAYGIISDLGQRQAILHNLFIHFGINKDVDEKDLLATTKLDLDKNTLLIPYLPLVKDMDEIMKVVKSTPILEVSKGKQSAYSGEKL